MKVSIAVVVIVKGGRIRNRFLLLDPPVKNIFDDHLFLKARQSQTQRLASILDLLL
jgi:hypothetical protein